jgi:hypothetical protein
VNYNLLPLTYSKTRFTLIENVCTWCKKEVEEQDFDLHTTAHYVEQQNKWSKNPSTTVTSISSVSYVKESL